MKNVKGCDTAMKNRDRTVQDKLKAKSPFSKVGGLNTEVEKVPYK